MPPQDLPAAVHSWGLVLAPSWTQQGHRHDDPGIAKRRLVGSTPAKHKAFNTFNTSNKTENWIIMNNTDSRLQSSIVQYHVHWRTGNCWDNSVLTNSWPLASKSFQIHNSLSSYHLMLQSLANDVLEVEPPLWRNILSASSESKCLHSLLSNCIRTRAHKGIRCNQQNPWYWAANSELDPHNFRVCSLGHIFNLVLDLLHQIGKAEHKFVYPHP
jgi:hypothetical protein